MGGPVALRPHVAVGLPFRGAGNAPARVRYSALHSEEGGRFLNAVSRYLVVEADESQAPLDPPPGFQWVSYGQLAALARHSHYVNVQARTLLACLNTLSARATAG